MRTILLMLVVVQLSAAQFRVVSHLVTTQSGNRAVQSESPTDDTLGLSAGRVRAVIEEPRKSTKLAMLLSAALPGAGQMYVERYLTIPLIWGFGVYFYNEMSRAGGLYQDYRDLFSQSILADTVSGLGNSNLRTIRDFYRDERDRFAIYLGLTYLLNIVDAYVGASLYGFDVSEDLGGNTKLNLRIAIIKPPAVSAHSRNKIQSR